MPARSVSKAKRPSAKKVSAKRAPAPARRSPGGGGKKKAASSRPKIKIVGKVTHYFDRINVAIIELVTPLKVGDTVTFKRGEQEHTQNIDSIQIDHAAVAKAKKGDVVGVKVSRVVHQGALVLPA